MSRCASRTGVYFELDRSATEIVRLVQRCGPAEAVEVLAARHGRPTHEIQADVDRVLHTLQHTLLPATARPRLPTWCGSAAVALRWSRLPLSAKVATVYASGLVVTRRGSSLSRPYRPRDPLARRTSFGLLRARGSPAFRPGVAQQPRKDATGRLSFGTAALAFRCDLPTAGARRRVDPATSPAQALSRPHRCRRRTGPRLAGCGGPHDRRAARGTCFQARRGTRGSWQR